MTTIQTQAFQQPQVSQNQLPQATNAQQMQEITNKQIIAAIDSTEDKENFGHQKANEEVKKPTVETMKEQLVNVIVPPHKTIYSLRNKADKMGTSEITDTTILNLVWNVIQQMRGRGEELTLQCLLNQQKLIHLALHCMVRRQLPIQSLQFNLEHQMIGFLQKINRVTMQNFRQQQQQVDLKVFAKAVDVLMHPAVERVIKDTALYGKLKVLTFNNLACIYKGKKKFGIALRAVTYALHLEEQMMRQKPSEEKYDIIPTYLNKAAILSEMGRHEKALEEIIRSSRCIQSIERQVVAQLVGAQNEQDSEAIVRLKEKKYYGLYMKMIIHYNMGAQKEHMRLVKEARDHYLQGRQLAVIIKNDFMLKKFDGILAAITTK